MWRDGAHLGDKFHGGAIANPGPGGGETPGEEPLPSI